MYQTIKKQPAGMKTICVNLYFLFLGLTLKRCLGRYSGYMLEDGHGVSYGYDEFGRLETLLAKQQNDTVSINYTRLAGTDFISSMSYLETGHEWARSYEPHRDFIASVENRHASTILGRYDYKTDAIGRRTSISRSGTIYDAPVKDTYGYNGRVELVSARRTLAETDAGVPGFAYDYEYDAIGNRVTSTEYDHKNLPLVSDYAANALNQYTQRAVPGYAAVRGVAESGASVTVNGNPALQQSPYFYGGTDVDNTVAPIMQDIAATASLPAENDSSSDQISTVSGKLYTTKTPESFTYDDDGNMLSDGRFSYAWDGENRLIRVETLPAAIQSGASPVRVDYAYDHQYRRIGKFVYKLDASKSWEQAEARHFIYDGWNLIRETISHNQMGEGNGAVVTHYAWRLDLSGTLQGSGGVGGLAIVAKNMVPYIPICDASGNITGYFVAFGSLVANYDYSPFGETLLQSGDLANEFAHRFSSKYHENETMLYDYGYRFNSPRAGRWVSRDPIMESGGFNLYGFVRNNPISYLDRLGLFTMEQLQRIIKKMQDC